jgi:hypothetical protein
MFLASEPLISISELSKMLGILLSSDRTFKRPPQAINIQPLTRLADRINK